MASPFPLVSGLLVFCVLTATPHFLIDRTVLASSFFVQQASNAISSSGKTLSFYLPSAAGAGNLLVVSFDKDGSQSATVSDSQGNTFLQAGTELTSPGGARARVYYAKNMAGGADTVTVTLSANSSYLEVYLSEYTGIDPANPIDTLSGASGSSSNVSSGNGTTTFSSDVIYGFCLADGACNSGTSFASRSGFHSNLVEDMVAGAPGSYAATGTSNSGWTMQMLALKPASPASPLNLPPSVPTGLTATAISSSQIDLAWTASTASAGIAGYRVFRNGSQIATTSALSVSDTGLVASTTYSYTVAAFDSLGKVSAQSPPVSATTLGSSSITASGPLTVLAGNPRYFTSDGTHAILLAGSHTWSNGMEDHGTINPPLLFDYNGYMKFMQAHNFNWMRLWTTEMAQVSTVDDPYENIIGPPYKWQRSTSCCANDGGNQFDFTQLDQNYFDRMRSRIIQAGQNGIYVSVMLFNGYMWQFDEISTDGNPFESGNNVNSISCGGVCPNDNSQIPSAAWGYEQAYLQKVVDTVNDLPNVMYEVSNEAGSPYSDSWEATIISFVKQYEATKTFQHPVGMTFQYQGGSDTTLNNSQADWVSPSTTLPPEATGNKVVINDTDHSYCWSCMKSAGQNAQREWVWENFTRGNNLGFMDPYLVLWSGRNACSGNTADPDVCTTVDPYWDELRNAMTDVRNYSTRMDLAHMTPQHALSTSGYCLANLGSQYLVFSTSNSFTLTVVAGTYTLQWFDPTSHALVQTTTQNLASTQTFTAPFSGDAVLYLALAPPDTTPPSTPTSLSATPISSSQVNLAWNASTDNVGVSGYTVFRNGVQIGTAAGTTYTDSGLSPGTTYSYIVSAFDAAGNASPQSASVSATTLAALPTPPSVSVTSPSSGSVVTGSITLSANASSSLGIAGVQFAVDGAAAGTAITAPPYSTVLNTTSLPNGLHTITATATDTAGNSTTSAGVSITVNNPVKSISFVQSRSLDCGTATSCSLSFTNKNASGNLLVVAIRVGDINRTVTLTDSLHNSYALARPQLLNADGDQGFVFYALNSLAGANTVKVSITGGSSTIRFAIHEFSGLSLSNSLDTTTSAQGSGASPASGSDVTTNTTELVFGMAFTSNSDSWTAGSGYTLREKPGNKLATEYRITSSAGTPSAVFTISPGDLWGAILVAFK